MNEDRDSDYRRDSDFRNQGSRGYSSGGGRFREIRHDEHDSRDERDFGSFYTNRRERDRGKTLFILHNWYDVKIIVLDSLDVLIIFEAFFFLTQALEHIHNACLNGVFFLILDYTQEVVIHIKMEAIGAVATVATVTVATLAAAVDMEVVAIMAAMPALRLQSTTVGKMKNLVLGGTIVGMTAVTIDGGEDTAIEDTAARP